MNAEPREASMAKKSTGPGDLIPKVVRVLGAVATGTRNAVGSVVSRVTGSARRGTKAAAPPTSPVVDASEDYDSLTVAEIKPRLAGLSEADLRKVREREAAGKGRKTVLAEIDRLLEK